MVTSIDDFLQGLREEEALSHHGVKGMRWGQRRSAKKMTKADQKWQNNIYTTRGSIAVHNHVADQMNNGLLDKLNSDKRWKGKKLTSTGEEYDTPAGKAYIKEYEKLAKDATKKAVESIHGTSPSGNLRATIVPHSNPYMAKHGGWELGIVKTDAAHADVPWEDLHLELERDSNGFFIGVANIRTSVQQSDPVGEFISHVGVKGMKWGVRKRRTGAEIKRRGKRQKLSDKRRSLSDDDLKKAVERIQTEKKLKSLVDEDLRPGKTIAKKIMSESGQKVAKSVALSAGFFAIKAVKGTAGNKLGRPTGSHFKK